MYHAILPHLRCPACQHSLELQHATLDAAGEIIGGELVCSGCARQYPVRAGIANFLGPARPPNITQLINELPAAAWGYERIWRPFALTLLSGQAFPYRRELPLMAELVDAARGGLYLDLACSNGLYARALTRTMQPHSHVAGVDHSLPMLTQARAFALQAGLQISYLRASAQALPIAAGAAAGVVFGGSLNEIGDLDTCLAEARRTLAPDGRFFAMSLARAATAGGRLLQQLIGSGGVAFWPARELEAHFRQQRLRTVARWQYGLVLFQLALPVGDA